MIILWLLLSLLLVLVGYNMYSLVGYCYEELYNQNTEHFSDSSNEDCINLDQVDIIRSSMNANVTIL